MRDVISRTCVVVMHSGCTCRGVTWIILGRFLDGDRLEQKIRNGIVGSGGIDRPLDERVVRRHERSGGEDGYGESGGGGLRKRFGLVIWRTFAKDR